MAIRHMSNSRSWRQLQLIVGRTKMTDRDRILNILAVESRWLTFDELYSKVHPDCDWGAFAEILEGLVAQRRIRYSLPPGADTGYYSVG